MLCTVSSHCLAPAPHCPTVAQLNHPPQHSLASEVSERTRSTLLLVAYVYAIPHFVIQLQICIIFGTSCCLRSEIGTSLAIQSSTTLWLRRYHDHLTTVGSVVASSTLILRTSCILHSLSPFVSCVRDRLRLTSCCTSAGACGTLTVRAVSPTLSYSPLTANHASRAAQTV